MSTGKYPALELGLVSTVEEKHIVNVLGLGDYRIYNSIIKYIFVEHALQDLIFEAETVGSELQSGGWAWTAWTQDEHVIGCSLILNVGVP